MPTFPIAIDRAILAHDLNTQIVEISRTTDADIPMRIIATAGGDEQRLRGIPVCGARGVGGAINGTRPGGRL